MSEPMISVIITVYNKGELFRKTLASALRQTFNSYEVVVINDGSTDNAEGIINEFNDPRIRYYYQDNSGLPAVARNKGIGYSKGKFVAFLDGDDIWYPKKLDRCYEIFRQYTDIDLVCHNEITKDVSGKTIRTLSYGPYTDRMFRRLLFKGNCLSPSATVIKKSALEEVGLFREDLDFFSVEDYDLWLRLSKEYKFYFIKEILGEYVMNHQSITSDFERHYINQIRMLKVNFAEYDKKKVSDYYLINLRIIKCYLLIIREAIRKGELKKAFNYFGKAFLQFLHWNIAI